ncbi:hypothetical protein ABIE53_005587 [Burkholderia sp. OAS925]|nr:hypothetical protein [Paraburkholderia graminis]
MGGLGVRVSFDTDSTLRWRPTLGAQVLLCYFLCLYPLGDLKDTNQLDAEEHGSSPL